MWIHDKFAIFNILTLSQSNTIYLIIHVTGDSSTDENVETLKRMAFTKGNGSHLKEWLPLKGMDST